MEADQDRLLAELHELERRSETVSIVIISFK
jgi:hypothetical protein